MIYFSQPVWLLAGFALVVPIAIHLLSRRSGRLIKVGSIKLLEDSQSRRWKSLKLSEVPLLLLRAVLLAVLVLLLARPHLKSDSVASDPTSKSWVLVAPSLLASQPKVLELESVLDSLAAAGHELRVLAPNFPPIASFDAETNFSDKENYWSLLREADAIAPGKTPLWVFTDDRLQNFRGERSALSKAVKWRTVSAQRDNHWIQNAWRTRADSAHVIIGFSDSHRTFFSNHDVRMPNHQTILSENGIPAVEVTAGEVGREFRIKLLQSDGRPEDDSFILRDNEPRRKVLILHDAERQEDARYVKFAFDAVAEFLRVSMQTKTEILKDGSWTNPEANIIFWLSSHPATDNLLRAVEAKGLILVNDAATDEYERCMTEMIMEGAASRPRVWRRVAPTQQGIAVWTDGFGSPLLECERCGEGWHYRFLSRFHPSWNELVLSSQFPEWILSLLDQQQSFGLHRATNLDYSDQRRISAAQLMPGHRDSEAQLITQTSGESLHLPVWILAVIIFMLERWMAARKQA
jgi:hypothetical protein